MSSATLNVTFSKHCVPHASLAIARMHSLDVVFSAVNDDSMVRATMAIPGAATLRGNLSIAKYLASLAGSVDASAINAASDPIEELILAEITNDALDASIQRLNAHLALRTFLTGHRLSYVDFFLYEQLRRCQKWTSILAQFSHHFPHFVRWFTFIDSLPEVVQTCKDLSAALKNFASTTRLVSTADKKAAAAGGAASTQDQKKQKEIEDDEFGLSLPGAKPGQVCTRFPPEPSGYLHIGHVKAALINDYFAKKYQGRLLLRFDDTNPAKEKEEFEHAIMEDLKRLGVVADKWSYTSDHFETLLEYAETFIKEGLAYVDDTPVEQLRDEKFHGRESANRYLPVEKNLELWEAMKRGERPDCVLRAKVDMTSKNKTMRDPVMYRTVNQPHARTGSKYSIYPTYDFACPIVDSIEGVTHALRSMEYNERNEQYAWFLQAAKVRPVFIWGFSRMNFVRALLSKRKLAKFVNEGIADGWNDPRFPTVQGLLRHGLTVEALRRFVLSQGASRNNNLNTWEKLWAENRRVIDPIVPRYTAIPAEDIVLVDLGAGVKTEWKSVPRHKKNGSLGNKMVLLGPKVLIGQEDAAGMKENEEVTFMDWGNVIIRKVTRDANNKVTNIEASLHLEGDFRKTEKKITWLAQSEDSVETVCFWFDHLITKDKLEEEDKLEDWVTPVSKWEKRMICDANVRSVQHGERIQFERVGFFICDAPLVTVGKQPVFFEIPDGHERKTPAA
jgi:glutamyl-tRNA synthetase